MWVIVTIECVFYALNNAIGEVYYKAVDMGGSMYIHTFGAYFGLAASFFCQNKRAIEEHSKKCVGGYNSQYIAMLGTVFLYCYWPSFNGALAPAISQQRVVVNTALSISASLLGACATARVLTFKFDMEIVLNATLAGGVIIGAASDIVVSPGISIIVGMGGGIISALGFAYLSAALRKHIGLHDTCGVHNLHAIPGVCGGLLGCITSALAGSSFANAAAVKIVFKEIKNGRTFAQQGGIQLATLATSLGIALLSGAFAGWVASKIGRTPKLLFEDKEHWMHVEYDFAHEPEPEDGHAEDKDAAAKNNKVADAKTEIAKAH